MNRKLAAAAAVVVASASAPALAEGWYTGLSVGRGGVNISAAEIGLSSGSLNDRETAWGARVGYDFTRYLGVEASYYDLGKYNFTGFLGPFPTTGNMKAQSYNFSLVGNLPFGERDMFGVYAKIGYARTKEQPSADVAGFSANRSDWESESVYGAGLRWMPDPHWGLFAEWSHLHETRIVQWMGGAFVRF